MPLNKNAFVRYVAIDRCLRKKHKPTLADFMSAIAEANDYSLPSKRQVQYDIQEMRQNQSLRFNAPIEFVTETFGQRVQSKHLGYYRYSDPNYSLLKAIEMEFFTDNIKVA